MKPEEQEAQDDLIRIFPMMVCGELQTLKQNLIDIRTLHGSSKTKKFYEVSSFLEKLKNQAVLFGYPLASDVASHLQNLIQNPRSFSEGRFESVHKDVMLLQEILWKKICGDGGERGRKILNQLVKVQK